MCHKNSLRYLLFLTILVLFVSACNAPPEADSAETPEGTLIVTNAGTETPSPQASPSATVTLAPTPTSLPSATATLVPTATPLPTATPVSPEFSNLILALDYNQVSREPLSPRDYFPAGVSYIAVLFDYTVPGSTRLDWQIVGANEKTEASGTATLTTGEGRKAFIVRPEFGLDEGDYELIVEFSGEVVLAKGFQVYWNPTLWPITLGANIYVNGEVADIGDRFPFGTEFLFASYPTINFSVGDELVAEWFVEGEKLGEYRYVWSNPDWSTGIHTNKIDNQVESGNPLPVGNYELIISVNNLPNQCKAFAITESANAAATESVQGCEAFEAEPSAPPSQTTWGRYEARTFSELDALTGELLSEITEVTAVYLETSSDYQYPSRVQAIFAGDCRETSEFKLAWIKTWMVTFAPNLTAEEVVALFAQECLFLEDTNEYWLPVQSSLVSLMTQTLSAGDEVELLVIWIGATIDEGQINRIYLVNAFE